jgi:hypothetical protein
LCEQLGLVAVLRLVELELVDRERTLREPGVDQQEHHEPGAQQQGHQDDERGAARRPALLDDPQ